VNPFELEAGRFVEDHVERVRPILHRAALAAWEAATSGTEAAIRESARLRAEVRKAHSRRDDLQAVRRMLASERILDPLLHRQIEVLDRAYTANQLAPEVLDDLTRREGELEGIFYNFRARLDGEEVNDNELRALLRTELDVTRRRFAWEASKEIGSLIAPRLLELVRRRNAAARQLGFENFYRMELQLQEIDPENLFELLEDFATRTDAPFREVRSLLDAEMAERFGVTTAELRPWHWADLFGQEAPIAGSLDLDSFFQGLDLEVLASFEGIGLPVDDVLARSDLHEREGKDQHAFATDIDREGDVRILCNLRSNESWARTLLHELGHAAYDKFLPRELPFLLRSPAHTLITEAVAMYFGRSTRDPDWLRGALGEALNAKMEAELDTQQRLSMLVSTRWMLVMAYFERELYRDPDRPELASLWWDLVERFQLIRRPEGRDAPDWATKIHLSVAPVYYHNYLLGELVASQITRAAREYPGGTGAYLRERIFGWGASLPWNELLREATGEPLTPGPFVRQFVALDRSLEA